MPGDRKGGRPRKDEGGTSRTTFTFRITAETRDDLIARAQSNGRSMSEQAEIDILLTKEWLRAFRTADAVIKQAQEDAEAFMTVARANAEAEIDSLRRDAGMVKVGGLDEHGNPTHRWGLAPNGPQSGFITPAVLSHQTIAAIAEAVRAALKEERENTNRRA